MGVLAYPSALATVQDALVKLIELGLGDRMTVDDTASLALVASRGASGTQTIFDRALAYVMTPGAVYRYSKFSTATADGTNIIIPSDAGSGPGRWLLTSSTILNSSGIAISGQATGYLRRVLLWAGERTDKIWKERILGRRPAAILQFLGETKTIRANQRGALAEKTYHFSVWAVSQNLRPDLEGEKGSPIAAEFAADPGVARIMGDLEYLLDGLRGVDIGVDGLDFLQFGAHEPGIEDYEGREFVWTAPLDVRVTVGKEDPIRSGLAKLFLQPLDVELHGQSKVDDQNHVTAGLVFTVGPGFTAAPSSGTAVIAGSPVVVDSPPAHVFTPSRATYRDLKPDGQFVYVEAYTDDLPPLVTPGAMRVGVTFTDFTGIVEDQLLVATVENFGPPTEIDLGNGNPDNKVYFGVGSDPGPGGYTQLWAETVIGGQGSDVSPSRQRSIAYNASLAGDYLWYLVPVDFGGSSDSFIDAATSLPAGFSIIDTVERDELSGAVVLYNIWRSDVAGLGALTVNVT